MTCVDHHLLNKYPNDSTCAFQEKICETALLTASFSSCHSLVAVEQYIETCVQDLCRCVGKDTTQCLCNTFAEYSRQCAHAGGHPENWRTKDLCGMCLYLSFTIFSKTRNEINYINDQLQYHILNMPLTAKYVSTECIISIIFPQPKLVLTTWYTRNVDHHALTLATTQKDQFFVRITAWKAAFVLQVCLL